MLINICNRIEVQKCTVFKIYKKILHSLKNTSRLLLSSFNYTTIFLRLVNLNYFSVILLADSYSLQLMVKEDITRLENLRARSYPCMYHVRKSSLRTWKNVYANYFSVKLIYQLENYLHCFNKTFFEVKVNVCSLNPPYFLSAALNRIVCSSIRLILFLNKTGCWNSHSELSCVSQISLCSPQSVMGRKKIEQKLFILS